MLLIVAVVGRAAEIVGCSSRRDVAFVDFFGL
jgi:hypothetical protein